MNYFKEFAQAIVEAGMSKICRAGGQDGDPGRSLYWSLESAGRLEADFPLPWGTFIFFLLSSSTN